MRLLTVCVSIAALLLVIPAAGPATQKAGLEACGTVDFVYTDASVSAKNVNCSSAREIAHKWINKSANDPCTSQPCVTFVKRFECRFKGTDEHLKLRCKHLQKRGKRVHADWGG